MGGELDAIGPADALEALRAELAAARAKAAEQDLQFPVQSVTVELRVGVTRSKVGKVGVRVPLVGAEIGGSVDSAPERLQTVTIVLGAPVDRAGNSVKVAVASDELKG